MLAIRLSDTFNDKTVLIANAIDSSLVLLILLFDALSCKMCEWFFIILRSMQL